MLSAALASESALSFLWIPIWIRIQQNITFLLRLMELSLIRNLTIRGLSSFQFLIDFKTEMESEWRMNIFELLVEMIFNAKCITEILAANREASFGRHSFFISLLKTAPHPVPLLWSHL